jgi:hypothetical protein
LVLGASDLAIDGRTVMKKLGIPPGPRVGKVIEWLLEKVIEDPGLNREERLLELLNQQRT